MSTIILKWNPSFSSLGYFRFMRLILDATTGEDPSFNWSVHEESLKAGDEYYFIKVGEYGRQGLVGKGSVIRDAYTSGDWRRSGKKIYYADFLPEYWANPECVPFLDSSILKAKIPGFDWYGGPSGVFLDEGDAKILKDTYEDFVLRNGPEYSEMVKRSYEGINDLVYLKGVVEGKD